MVEEPAERKVSYKNIFVTEVAQDEMVFYGQLEDDGKIAATLSLYECLIIVKWNSNGGCLQNLGVNTLS